MSETYYIGVDLGTSRTTVVTSTGKRLTKVTCVGYSSNPISKKRIGGKDYLLGEDAENNRLALEMVWPLGEGVINDDKRSLEATKLILKDIIAEALPNKKHDDKIFAAIGVPAEAGKKNKSDIIEITKDFIDKVLIVSEPFAVAYSLDQLTECLIIDIGAGSSDVLRFFGDFPKSEDSKTLSYAGNFLDKMLQECILEEYPNVQLTKKIVKEVKEKYGYVTENSDPIIVEFKEKGKPVKCDITKPLIKACLQLAQPICDTVQELVSTFDPEFQDNLKSNIIIAGGGSRLKGIDLAIEKSLEDYGGGKAKCVQDAEFQGSLGCLSIALELPLELWDKIN